MSQIETEVELGYFRPSLLEELVVNDDLSVPNPARQARLAEIDKRSGFEKHAEVYRRKRARKKAVAEYERNLGEAAA